MKKITLSLVLIMFAFVASAQNIGVLVQPQLETSITRKGFFAESGVIGRLGLYSDFKIGKSYDNKLENNTFLDKDLSQFNLGLSLKVSQDLKIIASSSVINKETSYLRSEDMYYRQGTKSVKSVQQLGILVNKSYMTVLLAYETDKRLTFGIGFNLK